MAGGLWHYTGDGDQEHPQEKEMQNGKMVVCGEALQVAEKRREAKGKGKKELYTHLNAEFQRIARRDKKAFLSDQLMGLGLFFGNDIKRVMLTFFFLFCV